MIRVGVLGATGSIGRQALEVIRQYPDKFKVSLLTAFNNFDALKPYILEFSPEIVVCKSADIKKIGNTTVYNDNDVQNDVSLYDNCDIVINGIGGLNGLLPSVAVLKSKANLASANKESIVSAGAILNEIAKQNNKKIIPVDSEHSAIFQCSESGLKPKKIILTASGGAFRSCSYEELIGVDYKRALAHPTWKMGVKVTIDSATLMNKGLEIVEAYHLFGDIEVQTVIHNESIIHSMVEFDDGSLKALLSYPDMRLPIAYSLTYPERVKISGVPALDFSKLGSLSFEEPDRKRFPCLAIGEYVAKNSNLGAVLVASDEIAVEKFIKGEIGFYDIPKIIDKSLNKFNDFVPYSIDDVVGIIKEVKEYISKAYYPEIMGCGGK